MLSGVNRLSKSLFAAVKESPNSFDGDVTDLTYTNRTDHYTVHRSGNISGNVLIPETYLGLPVWAVDDDCFKNNHNVVHVTFPESISNAGRNLFLDCTNLRSASFVRTIWNGDFGNSFNGCTSLEEVNLPEGFTTLEYDAFRGCTSLKSITLPDSCTSIGDSAFYENTSLETADLGEGIVEIKNNAFLRCSALKAIVLPDSCTTIRSTAFSECELVETITFGNSIEIIEEWAFATCRKVLVVDLPSTVTELGASCFRDCNQLNTFNLRTPAPPTLGADAFLNTSNLTEIHVPSDSTFGSTFGGLTVIKDL